MSGPGASPAPGAPPAHTTRHHRPSAVRAVELPNNVKSHVAGPGSPCVCVCVADPSQQQPPPPPPPSAAPRTFRRRGARTSDGDGGGDGEQPSKQTERTREAGARDETRLRPRGTSARGLAGGPPRAGQTAWRQSSSGGGGGGGGGQRRARSEADEAIQDGQRRNKLNPPAPTVPTNISVTPGAPAAAQHRQAGRQADRQAVEPSPAQPSPAQPSPHTTRRNRPDQAASCGARAVGAARAAAAARVTRRSCLFVFGSTREEPEFATLRRAARGWGGVGGAARARAGAAEDEQGGGGATRRDGGGAAWRRGAWT